MILIPSDITDHHQVKGRDESAWRSRVIAIYSGFKSIFGGFMSIMTSFSDSESEIFDF